MIVGSGIVSEILSWPGRSANAMMSLMPSMFANLIASRNDPGPSSAFVVTTNVVDHAGHRHQRSDDRKNQGNEDNHIEHYEDYSEVAPFNPRVKAIT